MGSRGEGLGNYSFCSIVLDIYLSVGVLLVVAKTLLLHKQKSILIH